jgi:hypothetical protein
MQLFGVAAVVFGIAVRATSLAPLTSNQRDGILILCVIWGISLLIFAASLVNPQPQSADRVRYATWWVPRSFRIRVLLVIGTIGVTTIIASQAHSPGDAMIFVPMFLTVLSLNALIGHNGNFIELRTNAFSLSRVATGHVSITGAWLISYSDVDSLRVKKKGDFELRYLDKGRREKVKKISFKIVPERRKEFLDEFLARLRDARPEGVTLTLDRELY